MDTLVFSVVLLAALLHATWNGMVKKHSDKAVALAGIILGHIPFSIVAIILLPAPSIDSIPYIFASIVVHIGYQWFLLKSYEIGDLTKVYPIARGTGPLFVTVVSILFLGVVLNQVDTRRASFQSFENELKFLLADKLFNSKISQLTEIADSPFYSKTVIDFNDNSRAKLEFIELSEEIFEKIGL